jgi:hypothetical protein
MKKVILLVFLLPVMAYGQIADNFESGSVSVWTQSTIGRWRADTTSSLSGRFSLHHIFDNPETGSDRIGIPTGELHPSRGNSKWSFLLRHGYDPSTSNNWAVFLMSDASPLLLSTDGNTNGFAIGVNLTGYDDTLRLWKVKGSILSVVVNCHINWQTVIGIADAVKIIVERTQSGDWTVAVSRLNGVPIGSYTGTDSELFSTAWFAILYRYSSTRDQLLWFDDLNIEGIFSSDNEPPVVRGCEVAGKSGIEISLDEEPSNELLVPANFILNTGENRPVSVKMINDLTFRVEFADPLINRSLNNLKIVSLCDKSGNCALNVQVPFTAAWAEPGDVIISEVMADPLPEVSLPGKEYLELTNLTNYPFNLKKWKLSTEDQNYLFPETTLGASGIAIVCLSQDTSLFVKSGKVIGLKQFPSLTDGGRIICLSDSNGRLIHGLEYSSDWYGDELKSGGGWSLEIIDTRYPFYYEGNWTASVSRKGGTPGLVNSVAKNNPDASFYGIQNVFPVDSSNIRIRFSEPVFNLPSNKNGIRIGGKEVTGINQTDPLFREFIVHPVDALSGKKHYLLDVSEDIADFAGNIIGKRFFDFGLPESSEQGDVLFNELLFDPMPGDPDYLELFNRSGKIIDASRLQLVSVNDESGDTSQVYPVSDEERCIMPGGYYAITVDKGKITDRYFSADPEYIFEMGSLPSMSDDKGHLILFNRELDLIDNVRYNDKMHFSLLSGNEGVALEKTSPQNQSEVAVNWHSASESSGWGTPGSQNSVFVVLPVTSDKIQLSSTRITPDNDGNEDFLVISFSLAGNGNIISVTIYDETGKYIRKITENMLAGPEASLIWDGTADDGTPVDSGIYIVFITLFDDTGKTEKWKKVCTVIR